ncbi:hypothetical protein [Acetobacteroides hydrogenigenes]|uniref:Uncharacterized protein n=1 Tax=Acetobacteroides hydrogenigenes TaxID=979970 RepID=A0A4V2RMY2_9BACT|nr:hypothetical protein [Acetobacteroides hydrogenigenes]TCN61630.1 hypothetical protein CLV25_12513 [Acetobacteroides hydrogenigenes]
MKLFTNEASNIVGLGEIGHEVVNHIVNNVESLFVYKCVMEDELGARIFPLEVNTVEELSMRLKQHYAKNREQFNFIILDVDDSSAIALFEDVATRMIDCSLKSKTVATIGVVLNRYEREIPKCISAKANFIIEVCQSDVNRNNGLYSELMALPIGVLYKASFVISWICIDYYDVLYHLRNGGTLRIAFAYLGTITENQIMQLKQIYFTSNTTFSYFYFDEMHTLDYIGETTAKFFNDIPENEEDKHNKDIMQGGVKCPPGIYILYQPAINM